MNDSIQLQFRFNPEGHPSSHPSPLTIERVAHDGLSNTSWHLTLKAGRTLSATLLALPIDCGDLGRKGLATLMAELTSSFASVLQDKGVRDQIHEELGLLSGIRMIRAIDEWIAETNSDPFAKAGSLPRPPNSSDWRLNAVQGGNPFP